MISDYRATDYSLIAHLALVPAEVKNISDHFRCYAITEKVRRRPAMPSGGKKPIREIAISEFKAKCLSLLEEVNKTKTPLRVTRRGKLIADVIPPFDGFGGKGLDRLHGGPDRNHRRHNLSRHRNSGNRGSEIMRLLLDTHIWIGVSPSRSVSHVAYKTN